MSESRYVQHVSGQGEKWKLWDQQHAGPGFCYWKVHSLQDYDSHTTLPKSEYRLCEPPERWVDVTGWCTVLSNTEDDVVHDGDVITQQRGYRIRLVELFDHDRPGFNQGYKHQWAFVVDKKVTS